MPYLLSPWAAPTPTIPACPRPFPVESGLFLPFDEEPGHQSLLLWPAGAVPAGDPGQVASCFMVVLRVLLFEGGAAADWGSGHWSVLRSCLVFLPGGQSSTGCHGVCSSHNSEKSLPAVH